jgi:hypothetical protein
MNNVLKDIDHLVLDILDEVLDINSNKNVVLIYFLVKIKFIKNMTINNLRDLKSIIAH